MQLPRSPLPAERRGRAGLLALLGLTLLLLGVWLVRDGSGTSAVGARPIEKAPGATDSSPLVATGGPDDVALNAPSAQGPGRVGSLRPGVRLPGEGRLDGLVLERATGAPVAGAEVRLLSLPPSAATILGRVTEMTGLGPSMRRKVDPVAFVTTAPDGSFAFEGVREGRWYVDVAADYHVVDTVSVARLSASGSGGPLVVWTRAGGRVVGQVQRPDGSPAARAQVMLTTGAMGFLDAAQRGEVSLVEVEADDAGRFAFPAVAPAKGYELSAVGEGFAVTHRMGIDVAPGRDTEVTLVARPGATIRGRVVSREVESGVRALEGAQVGAVPRGLRHLRFVKQILEHTHAVTDERGEYVLHNVPPGAADVLAIASEHTPGKAPLVRVGVGGSHVAEDLVLDRGPRARGRVVDSEGSPIAGVRVMWNLVDFSKLEGDVSFAPLMVAGMRSFEYPETAVDGTFETGAIAGRAPFDLRFMKAGFKEHGIRWDPKVDGPEVEVVLQRGGAVSGRVVGADGAPLERFSLRTRQRVEDVPDAPSRWNPFAGTRDFEAPDGRFRLEGLEPGDVSLVVSAPDCIDRGVRATVTESETSDLGDVVLERGATLRGRVVDAAGEPVVGAQVTTDGRVRRTFDRLDGNRREAERSFGVPDDFRARARGRRAAPPLGFLRYMSSLGLMGDGVAISGDDGAFELSGLEPGTHDVLAFHRDYKATVEGPVELAAADVREGLVVELFEGGTLHGTVTDRHGRPVTDATVIAASPGAFEAGRSKGGVHQAGTDSGGAYELRNLEGGGYFLVVTRGDEDLAPMSFLGTLNLGMVSVPAEGRRRHDIVDTSAGGCRVHGFVRADGEPVERGALIAMNFEVDSLLGLDVKIANVEADGRYEFEGLAPGEYQVTFEGPGPRTQFLIEVPDAAEERLDLDLPRARLGGRVVEASTGEPVVGAELRLEALDRIEPEGVFGQLIGGARRFERDRAGEDGEFEFTRLAPGRYRVTAYGPRRGDAATRFAPSATIEVELDVDERREDLEFELPPSVDLPGLVLDDLGVPLAGALVVATRADSSLASARAEEARSEDDGRFVVRGLGPGAWDVVASRDGYAPSTVRGVELDETGSSEPLELRLERGLDVTVRVTDASGTPVEGAVASLTPVDGEAPSDPSRLFQSFFRGEATTDADGKLGLGTFASGLHELVVRKGLRRERSVVELPAGGGTHRLDARL